jgi:serine protease AprX
MNSLKTLGLALTTALLTGCGTSETDAGKAQGTTAQVRSGRSALQGGGSKKSVVEQSVTNPSACTATYSSPQAQAALTQAVVDPGLAADGLVKTLVLSFNTQEAVAPAVDLLSSTLGLSVGEGLGAFEALPMVAVKVPVTPALVDTLRTTLQPLGLLSIYQDRPLRYFLDQSVAYIQADTARTAFQATGAGVGVGVIDSGIDGTHGDFPTLARNVKVVAPITDVAVTGALYVDTPNSDLTSGHGTHVASTIAGSGARSGGKYQGVAPGATLVGVGAGDAISILYALEGFDFLLKPDIRETYNVRVISNSWGTSGSHFAPFDPVNIASKRAYDEGMVVAFAAGNDGPGADTLNPYSASPCALSVGAGHAKDTRTATHPLIRRGVPGQLASFSSRGIPGDAYHYPDIVLPGVTIVAARATTATIAQPYTGLDGLSPEPLYAALDGTSMATPHLSGLAALMLEVNPALDLDGVLAAVTSTARPMYTQDATTGTTRQLARWEVGAGYADAYAAVRAASESAGSRTITVTTALPGWSGEVGTTVQVPLADISLTGSSHEHALSVPSGANALRITTDWGNPAFDLDLYVYNPSGNLVASSANGVSASERVSISYPVAGTWRVQLKGYLNTTTRYTGSAEVDKLVPVSQ